MTKCVQCEVELIEEEEGEDSLCGDCAGEGPRWEVDDYDVMVEKEICREEELKQELKK